MCCNKMKDSNKDKRRGGREGGRERERERERERAEYFPALLHSSFSTLVEPASP